MFSVLVPDRQRSRAVFVCVCPWRMACVGPWPKPVLVRVGPWPKPVLVRVGPWPKPVLVRVGPWRPAPCPPWLRRRTEIEDHRGADRCEHEADVEHRVHLVLRRVQDHRVEVVHDMRTAEDEWHDVEWQAAEA